jgi:signal transduction histidine kinase
VLLARLREFVRQVRDGEAQPEAVEDVLRAALADPQLRLLLRIPGAPEHTYVDLSGSTVEVRESPAHVLLRTGATEVGAVELGSVSARRIRRAHEAAVQARLPIEVSRLRLELRGALDEVRSSRSRLMLASAVERRRLEQDLHDGAQQQIVAVGMRLRSVQRQLDPAAPAYRDLDAAVDGLERTVAELRELAHGIRPSRLDDGLPAALRALAAESPIPVDLAVAEVETSEIVATTLYFVIAETVANALKHANASRVSIAISEQDHKVCVDIVDDGVGGASTGFGMTAARDRVAAIGGQISVRSPAGLGTAVRVEV